MQTRKIKHTWAIAGAVAAMLAASTAAVHAQDTSTPGTSTPPGTNQTSGTTPGAGTAPLGGTSGSMDTSPNGSSTGNMRSDSLSGSMKSGSMAGGMMGHSILNNRTFDAVDLQQAKARGFSDSQIATTVKIAKETGMSFHAVAAAVARGETFAKIATANNLKLGDVYDVDKEKQEIADYEASNEYASSLLAAGSGSMAMSGGTETGSTGMSASSTPMSADTNSSSSSGSSSAGMATMDIVDTAMAAKNLTTLVKALQVAGLVETLKGAGPFTVFAPDDRAFSRLPAGQLDTLLADPVRLKTILTYHVIPASVMAADAAAMTSPTSPPTVQGGTLQVTSGRRGRLRINNDATVTKADIKASNGVIHIIDRVLMPPADASAPATDGTTPAPAQ